MNNKPYYEVIKLDKLYLDSDNPRLPKSLQGSGESAILEYMLLDASLIELMLAIGKNDFFPGEQLLVVKQKNGTYKVVEGNRRLSALKLLSNPGLATVQKSKVQQVMDETSFRPTDIPCLVFTKGENIHDYLGYRHITGIKEWKLLEKARYLFELWKSAYADVGINVAAKELAKSIGSKRNYVKRLLVGYEIYQIIEDEKFYRINGLDDTTFYFNYIADSLTRGNISAFLGVDLNDESENYVASINHTNLKKWTQWLFEKNTQLKTRLIGDSESLTALNTILGHEEAKVAFDKGISLEAARELTGELDNQFIDALSKALQFLENADRLVAKVNTSYEAALENLKVIRLTSSKITRTLQDRQDEDTIS